jgi:hypothetical protein
MLSFKQYLQARSAPCVTKKPKTTLQEGIALNPSDLMDQLTALGAKSLFAKVIADNDDEVTLHLTVKKWGVAN